MGYLSTFGIVLSLAYIVSSKPVKGSPIPQIHDVVEGHNLTVVCNASRADDSGVYWVKDDTKSLSNSYHNGTELSFTDIHRSATGTYVCLLQNETSPDDPIPLEEVKINVLYLQVSFNVTPTVLMENNVFHVSCEVSGNPTPDFVITNSRTGISYGRMHGSGSVAGGIRATCEDRATWVCTGSSHLFKSNVTRSANVTVFCGPKPDVSRMETLSKVEAAIGNSRPLEMFNYGYPYPKYTWSHNGKIFPNESHKDYGYSSVLQIDDIHVEDFGRYYIDMINEYGFTRSMIELVPNGPPEKPYNLEITDISHDSAKLRWTSGYDMGSPQHFLVLRYEGDGSMGGYYTYHPYVYDDSSNHGVGAEHEFLATGMWPDTTYAIAIVAQNSYEDTFGWPVSMYSDKVMIRTKVAPPSTTTTQSPPSSLYSSVGFIAGVSTGVGLLFAAVVVIIVIIAFRRYKEGPYQREKTIHYRNSPPLQLGVSTEMKKQVLT